MNNCFKYSNWIILFNLCIIKHNVFLFCELFSWIFVTKLSLSFSSLRSHINYVCMILFFWINFAIKFFFNHFNNFDDSIIERIIFWRRFALSNLTNVTIYRIDKNQFINDIATSLVMSNKIEDSNSFENISFCSFAFF